MKGERISAVRAVTLEARARGMRAAGGWVAVDAKELLVLLASEEAGWERAAYWRSAARWRHRFRILAVVGWALAALFATALLATIYGAPPAHWLPILQQWSGR